MEDENVDVWPGARRDVSGVWGECGPPPSHEMSTVAKKLDSWFNDGKTTKAYAKELADYATCTAFERSVIGMCKQVVRSRADPVSLEFTAIYDIHFVGKVENGFKTHVPWAAHGKSYTTTCYTDTNGNLLRVTTE